MVKIFVNRLANTPKEFDKSRSELKAEIAEFDNVVEKLEEEYRASHIGKGTAAAGLPLGRGRRICPYGCAGGRNNFGTASTGTAIATVKRSCRNKCSSGMARRRRTGCAGGGGSCQQEAHLLALAGPIGWGLVLQASLAEPYSARRKTVKSLMKHNRKSARFAQNQRTSRDGTWCARTQDAHIRSTIAVLKALLMCW